MVYKRHIYMALDRISKRKAVVAITGARQVGKSTMLKEQHPSVTYLTFDDPILRAAAIGNPSAFFKRYKPPIIIDEIQKGAVLFDYIKLMADSSKDKGRFFLTGSQSLTMMQGVSDSLAGRVGVIKMLGLSLRELDNQEYYEPFLPKTAIERASSINPSLHDYDKTLKRIHTGSFPELYETPGSLLDWSDFFGSYFQTYIEKDVKDVLNIQDELAFIKFVRAAASLTGELLNMTTLAQMCGKDVKTVQKWLSVLESSGLVYLLWPYHNNFSKRLIKTPKLYFLDTGLACWLLAWNTPDQLASGASFGKIFETYAFGEILKSYYNAGISSPSNLYFYRDKDKVEIDLVIEEAGVLYPVEIKSSSDPVKSMASSFRVLKNVEGKAVGEGAVVCMCRDILPLCDGAWTIPIEQV